MKVLHIINSLEIGGAEKLISESLTYYSQFSIEVELLTLKHLENFFLTGLLKDKIIVKSLNSFSVYNPLNILKIIPYLKGVDIIHVHLFPAQYWVVFAKKISFSKVKLIFTEHNTTNRRWGNCFFKIFDRFTYNSYSKIGCITEDVKKAFDEYLPLLNQKSVIIRNGIRIEKYTTAEKICKSKISLSFNETDKLILQISAFRPQKNQETLIKSMKFLPSNVKLLLVGDGERKKICQDLSFNLGLESRVHFLGNREDIPSLLKSVDVSVLSSNWEGFGLVAVESMAAGIPIIGSNVSGLSSIIGNEKLLFEVGNEIELSNKIKAIIFNKLLNIELKGYCEKRAAEFDIKKMVEKYAILYNIVLTTS